MRNLSVNRSFQTRSSHDTGIRLPRTSDVRSNRLKSFSHDASPLELQAVKLSLPLDPVGPSLMSTNRALHNPPVSVPRTGLPSHQAGRIETDYLLVCEAHSTTLADGRWRFTLEAADGETILDADDHDYGDLNRLTLLAAVRGLESLDGPSSVTLLSNNRYLIRSLSNSLPRWRQNDFRWEHFGRRIDVQHADLWRRVDSALMIHRVQACLVSSCLVSHGLSAVETKAEPATSVRGQTSESNAVLRRDGAHGPTGTDAIAPSERLRGLLLGRSPDLSPAPARRRKGRFTARDLDAPE